jgi:hypothetical protein
MYCITRTQIEQTVNKNNGSSIFPLTGKKISRIIMATQNGVQGWAGINRL